MARKTQVVFDSMCAHFLETYKHGGGQGEIFDEHFGEFYTEYLKTFAVKHNLDMPIALVKFVKKCEIAEFSEEEDT